MSLAGVQTKLSVTADPDGRICIPVNRVPVRRFSLEACFVPVCAMGHYRRSPDASTSCCPTTASESLSDHLAPRCQ